MFHKAERPGEVKLLTQRRQQSSPAKTAQTRQQQGAMSENYALMMACEAQENDGWVKAVVCGSYARTLLKTGLLVPACKLGSQPQRWLHDWCNIWTKGG